MILAPMLAQVGVAAPAAEGLVIPVGATSLAVIGLAVSAWLIFALWALFRSHGSQERARSAESSLAWYRMLVDRGPQAFIAVQPDGQIAASAQMTDWFALERPLATLDDLRLLEKQAGLSEQDVERLLDGIEQLEATGQAFSARVSAADGHRYFEVTGTRMTNPETGQQCQVLWWQDCTAQQALQLDLEETVAALTSARDDLTALIDAAPFPAWLRASDLTLKLVNQAYASAVERPSKDAVVADNVELLSNPLATAARDNAARAQSTGEVVNERHFAVIDGQRRALAISDRPLDGQDAPVAGFAVDITDYEEARTELGRYMDSQSETLNKLSTPVAIFGADKKLQFFNSAFAKLWHLDEGWLAETPHHGEVLEAMREARRLPEQADFPAWKKENLAAYTNLLEPLEEMWHLPDGSTLRVVTQPHPLGGLLILYEDVTDRLALERSYNTLIAVQRETLDNLHEGVAVFGGDGRLKLYNPTFTKLWNLTETQLANEPHVRDVLEHCRQLLAGEDQWPNTRDALLGQVTGRQAYADRLERPDSSVLDYAAVPLPDGAVLLTFVDVTASATIETALRERNEALETADRLKSEFVANMSYELRTPLNSIIGFTELMENGYVGPLNDRQMDYVRSVLSASHQLRELINDILDLAVIEAGAMELEVSTIAVKDVIESVVAMAGEYTRKARVKVAVECASSAGTVEGDSRRIRQALYNLVTNAANFTPRGGRVLIAAKDASGDAGGDDRVLITVSDTGIGIAEEEQERVFDKFQTGGNGTGAQGVGLGLALVRSFVELHGGSVSLTSEPNVGTTVTCLLPRHQPADVVHQDRRPDAPAEETVAQSTGTHN